MLSHLLVMRLSLVTVAGGSLAVWAHFNGFVVPVFAGDVSYLSYVIVGLFFVGLASTFWRAVKVGAEIDRFKLSPLAWSFERRKVRKMHDKAAHINDIAAWLQVLGLLGTVIGFSIALSGLEGDNTQTVISGLRTAIGTTILGGILSLWTAINVRILDTATAGLVEDLRQ